jgi:phage virion morphogenesis protein
MAKEPIRIELDSREVLAALADLEGRAGDMTDLMADLAGILEGASERAFQKEKDPATGAPWAELSETTKQRRADPLAKILQDSGSLVGSLDSEHDSNSATVGFAEKYASTHHFGAKKGQFGTASGAFYFDGESLRPRQVPIPWGDIPARPIVGISKEDEQEILDAVSAYIRAQS